MKLSQLQTLLAGLREKQGQDSSQFEPTPEPAVETTTDVNSDPDPAPEPAVETTAVVSSDPEPTPEPVLIKLMNDLLNDEFTAIHEYRGHYAVAKNLGYNKFAAAMKERMDDEQKHADALLYRIVSLKGTPVINSKPNSDCGMTVQAQLDLDLAKENDAVAKYNDAVAVAVAEKDNITRALFEANLADENDHVDELGTALDMIKEMGLGPYLVTQA